MSFKNHNNNDKQPVNTTYSPVSFANPEAMDGSRLNIGYFNKLLQVTIQKKNGTKNDYATYETEHPATIYLSITKAKILYDLIKMMQEDDSIHNVCVETNKGLITVHDGSEFGVNIPCISISTADESGNVSTVVYQTKDHYHKGAFNYDMNDKSYKDQYFNSLEIEVFENVLLQYYNAATYAIAATVMEANMYKHNALRNTINAIAEKVGVEFSNNSGGGYSSKSQFLNNNNDSGSNGMSGIPKEYESATFDDIAHGMGA